MKINQVEELVGITKKNIRFYEDAGLLNPKRNPQNDYRDYSLEDVQILERIKLLRKLSVPIEEIRLLFDGKCSFKSCMENQIERLTKEQQNAERMKELCSSLNVETIDINALNAAGYLDKMTELEKGGTKFVDIEKEDIKRKKKSGAAIAAAVFCGFMGLILLSIFIALKSVPTKEIFGEGFLPLLIVVSIIICVIAGTIIALKQRFNEINKGEEYEARNY
ncbi:MAG: MerR family transcriptional regulator [Treponemataceae bacterium]|nr:MerR family transcriptional regulator [Treponemataceae bacterium]